MTASEKQSLTGTEPLQWEGDIAARLVEGVDAFLTRELGASVERRAAHWARDLSSAAAYAQSVAPNRRRLAHILGVRDERAPVEALELVGTTRQPALVGCGANYEIRAVRWPAFGQVQGEGLLLTPLGRAPLADIIALPDADQVPEEIAGLAAGKSPRADYARRLAASGCRVIVPVLIDRRPALNQISRRELIYRSAYELGRHLIGYEVQKVLALVDWCAATARTQGGPAIPLGTIGWGEGGLLALCAAALDERINAACVSGYFAPREGVWQELIERNVFGLLEQFGDAELATLIAPRALVVEAAEGPAVTLACGRGGAAPGRLETPAPAAVRAEVERARALLDGLRPAPHLELVPSGDGTGPPGARGALEAFFGALGLEAPITPIAEGPTLLGCVDAAARQARQFRQLDDHNQLLLRQSPKVRADFFARLDISTPARFEATIASYRTFFYDEVIGRFADARLPFRARSRLAYDEPEWRGYEVVLDVWPDVIAYGILLLPRDLKEGERRPVVVCQHGLEGRPQQVVEGDEEAYHDFAARLCSRGFITFAPQNLYIFGDRFRTLQRKANPLKKTLFSIIVEQHRQIVDWLGTLPWVERQRIAFYGLSYGGKTAMRVPPLVDGYCLSICSADYNEWVWKNAANWSSYSYVGSGEYEIFEFDLGSTFNYAEMSWLICPRPFMVERGHFDGVAPDEWVAYEYAKTQRHYDLLGLGERTRMEVFAGPHTIHGVGTFEFLHEHLDWPQRG